MSRPSGLRQAVLAELVKVRAYRLTYWLLPLCLVSLVGAAALGYDATSAGLAAGADARSTLEGAAFAFGSGSLGCGILICIYAAAIVTADLGSGTVNHSLIAATRGTVVAAKVTVALLVVTVVSAAGFVAVTALGFVMLPSSIMSTLLLTSLLWTHVAGVVAALCTWAGLGLALALFVRRQAAATGLALLLVLAIPLLSSALTLAGRSMAWLDLLPGGLMQAATVTGSQGVPLASPLLATAGLLLWTGAFVAGGWWWFRRA